MKRLLLAGGGHAHLHVLKTLAEAPWPGVEVVLVSPFRRQLYSGMVPGWMAGHYRLDQCAAAVGPLAVAAGARFVEDVVTGIDAGQRLVHTRSAGSFPYDVLSLDTGAEVDDACLAATGARLASIRPLEGFVSEWAQAIDDFRQRGTARVVVVGGGAAGVELALAARFRLAAEVGTDVGAEVDTKVGTEVGTEVDTNAVRVTLVAAAGLLPGYGRRVVARVARALAERGVDLVHGRAVGCAAGVRLDSGVVLAADCVIAATGVRPAAWLAASGLALADDGFVAVGDGQASISHAQVFAAGDVASRVDRPHAKSGVYAVRAGPVLAANLRRALAGLPPLPYPPQRRSLYLLATGPRDAIVSWGGLSAGGYWAWRWKDWIDRRFLRRYEPSATQQAATTREAG
ncbi:MAG TPA: FAD-dependent oxidoreductase [Azospira sp.]|nr:FAD-dependent oxidoreductase [Azospira sp.]